MKSFIILSAVLALAAAAPKPRQAPDILAGCGDVKQCWGFFTNTTDNGLFTVERDCNLGQEQCSVIVTWSDLGDGTVNFEVQGNEPGGDIGLVDQHWVAVGFSTDNQMGEDTVVFNSAGMQPPAQLWWNRQGHSGPAYVGDDSGVLSLDVQGGDGFIYAAFNRLAVLSFIAPDETGPLDVTNDLTVVEYYLLASAGPLEMDDITGQMVPTRHDVRGFSATPYLMAAAPPPPPTTMIP